MKLILASSSKQRRDILDMIGLKYEVITSLVEEDSNESDPVKYVKELSRNKALSVKEQLNEKAIIIAADTIISLDNKIFEKPKTKDEAFNNMKKMSGKITKAITGVTILDLYQNKEISFEDISEVKFNNISDDDIKWYVDNEDKLLNVSGYVLRGKASLFLDYVNGDYNTIFGISPSKVYKQLMKLGYKLSDFELK